MTVFWWMSAGFFVLSSLFFFVMTLFLLKLVGRLSLRLIFDSIISCVLGFLMAKIKQHPEWMLDSEGRSRPWFRRCQASRTIR